MSYTHELCTHCIFSKINNSYSVIIITNYYRISRKTVHSNGLNWFEDREGDFPDDRLHALTANSEIYRKGDGLCKYDDNCEKNATVCHHIDEVEMTNIHASYSSMKNEKKEENKL